MEILPKLSKRRVFALKNLQVKCAHIDAKFYKEVHELTRKYSSLYQPLFNKRSEIINAAYEPTDEECQWKADEEEELTEVMKEKAKIEEKKGEGEDPKGIPEFWLTAFHNVDQLSEMVQEHDEPVLKHLQDIKVKLSDPGQPMSFTLEFHFEPNDFFTNAVLTKTYKKRSVPDEDDPFLLDGPDITECIGCKIEWKKGKKPMKKHKGRSTAVAALRKLTKVPSDSFFNFFTPPVVPESGELDEDSQAILDKDFDIGDLIRECIVPKAVLYFTGEATEDDCSSDDDDDDADESVGESEESSEVEEVR